MNDENILRSYQIDALNAIKEALSHRQKHIIVEIPTGMGKGLLVSKTVELLHKEENGDVLVVTNRLELKNNVEQTLYEKYQNIIQLDKNRVTVTTEQTIIHHTSQKHDKCKFIIIDGFDISESFYEELNCREKTLIIFLAKHERNSHGLFSYKDVVFSYTYQQAVRDGYITPAMETQAIEPAIVVFSEELLKTFGYTTINAKSYTENLNWDLVVEKCNSKIWVECKAYKSQVVSPSAASSLLNSIVLKRIRQGIPKEEPTLLIVSSTIPSFQKDVIYDRHQIIVWDIENLVFYCKNNLSLLKLLSQITYFPIDCIEGKRFDITNPVGLSLASLEVNLTSKAEIIQAAEEERNKAKNLIQKLNNCKTGQDNSRKYEKICEEIIRTLFEANYFNRLTSQHKTNDAHFRMDLIGAMKINQTKEECMHPFWQMLVQHYNSHFVIFEFKNYSEKIDQNLIYITEKYLFDAALRNVAIIISRNGFSDAAKFAAEGCLKEHGKLILDITDKDLIEMLELKSDKAADYILGKLEEFLMKISK